MGKSVAKRKKTLLCFCSCENLYSCMSSVHTHAKTHTQADARHTCKDAHTGRCTCKQAHANRHEKNLLVHVLSIPIFSGLESFLNEFLTFFLKVVYARTAGREWWVGFGIGGRRLINNTSILSSRD